MITIDEKCYLNNISLVEKISKLSFKNYEDQPIILSDTFGQLFPGELNK